jgi:hypothetical protein
MTQLWEIPKAALAAVGSAAAMFAVTKLIGHRQLSQLAAVRLYKRHNHRVHRRRDGHGAGGSRCARFDRDNRLRYGWCGSSACCDCENGRSARGNTWTARLPYSSTTDGTLYRENMATAKLDLSEFLCLCRQAGYFDPCPTSRRPCSRIHGPAEQYSPPPAARPVSPD